MKQKEIKVLMVAPEGISLDDTAGEIHFDTRLFLRGMLLIYVFIHADSINIVSFV